MPRPFDIIRALDDPNLFAPFFRGSSWRGWRAYLKALFALPMGEEDLALYREHTGRTNPPTKPLTETAVIVGRRGGKSRVLALVAVWLAFTRDYAQHLAPGEMATIAVLASTRPQARSIFRFVIGLIKAVPMLAVELVDASDEQITLSNRVVIEISTASFRSSRGYSYAAALADEVAFWRSDETAANPDTEIIRALRPGMASIPGSILLLASSPYAKRGELYNAYRRHFGRDDARVLVWKASTEVMNPKIDPAIIAEAYADDPEAARAEYGAEFRDDLADFVTREVAEACVCWGRSDLPPQPGITYAAFVDPSGGVSDAMAMAIGHLDQRNICVLDSIVDVKPPFDPERAVEECVAELRRFNITTVIGDRYAGEWPRARFGEHGIVFEQSARPKSDLYRDLAPLLNARRLELLDNTRLINQLCGLERRTARSGKDSIDHAPGAHDDVINAAAGVLVGLDLDRRPPLVSQADFLSPQPIPIPEVLRWANAVVCASRHGEVAVVYFGQGYDSELEVYFLDFDLGPFARTLFADLRGRLGALAKMTYARSNSVWAPAELLSLAADDGVAAMALPEVDEDKAPFCAAKHVKLSHVRKCDPVREKERTLPLGAALDFRAGDESEDNPLRQAAILAVLLGVEADPAAYRPMPKPMSPGP
jgi:hypothetical protein